MPQKFFECAHVEQDDEKICISAPLEMEEKDCQSPFRRKKKRNITHIENNGKQNYID